jgi:chemotaxis protein methyltransferase CheR
MSPAAQKKPDDYQSLLVALQEVLGVVVDGDNHAQLKQKLEPVMTEHGFGSLNSLAEAMHDEPSFSLRSSVLQSITSHDAEWFGYPDIKALLQEYILPGIINENRADYRIWMVGCGEGQIVYSIAMIIEEFRQQHELTCNIEIEATDLFEAAVEKAVEGHYEASALSGLPLAYKQKYMDVQDGQYDINQEIRSMVQFKICNLLESFTSMGHFDLVICPDVMVYFSNEAKSEVLSEFAQLLSPSGVLIVSANEPVTSFCDQFELVNHESGVFYRQISG